MVGKHTLHFIFGGLYMTKHYSVFYQSPIGMVEMKGTEEAVLSILFIDDNKSILDKGGFIPQVLKNCYQQLDEYFNGERTEFTIPYALEGTSFQKSVWSALSTIPYGKVHTYKELAERLGKSNASRAVGNANRLNQLSIVVPCHRIISSNGDLTGYAGGLWRKKWLLQHEIGIQNLSFS